jgi:hypothetical protein
LSPYLKDILGADYDKVQHFSHSFNFLGLDLLGTPSSSPWSSIFLHPAAPRFLPHWSLYRSPPDTCHFTP